MSFSYFVTSETDVESNYLAYGNGIKSVLPAPYLDRFSLVIVETSQERIRLPYHIVIEFLNLALPAPLTISEVHLVYLPSSLRQVGVYKQLRGAFFNSPAFSMAMESGHTSKYGTAAYNDFLSVSTLKSMIFGN